MSIKKKDQIRLLAESNLFYFAKLVNPQYMYGDVHKEVCQFLMKEDVPNQLVLLPRGHLKSHIMAVWCAWHITRHPETTILYLSATSELAEMQLKVIKDILCSPIYRRYWPEMVNIDEGKREKWSATKLAIDHPKRKYEGTRDATVTAAGLTTTTTGWHADIIVPDDVVVPDNAYTEDSRRKVANAMSQMASILNTGGMIKACGTRYHPSDQYNIWLNQKTIMFDDDDNIVDEQPIWEVFERVVEVEGVFLWPRSAREDGKFFGFDRRELARISAMYTDRAQYMAQYYLDPNDPESSRLKAESFNYYDMKYVKRENSRWWFSSKPMNVYAGIDFAYSFGKNADSTAIIVAGIDSEGFIYVLDIDRFKTDKISVYYDHLLALHSKWQFNKLRAEVTAAQKVIVEDIKDRFRREGLTISIDEHRPTRWDGSKKERIKAILEPRYESSSIYHFRGGYTPILEEQVLLARPKHDDIADVFAMVVEIMVVPKRRTTSTSNISSGMFSKRFGGVSFGGRI